MSFFRNNKNKNKVIYNIINISENTKDKECIDAEYYYVYPYSLGLCASTLLVVMDTSATTTGGSLTTYTYL